MANTSKGEERGFLVEMVLITAIACSIAVLCHDIHGDGRIARKTEIGDERQFRLSQMEVCWAWH